MSPNTPLFNITPNLVLIPNFVRYLVNKHLLDTQLIKITTIGVLLEYGTYGDDGKLRLAIEVLIDGKHVELWDNGVKFVPVSSTDVSNEELEYILG